MSYKEFFDAKREFESCDHWWSQLSAMEKMWVHRYFHELPDQSRVPFETQKIKDTHDFNLLTSSATECGGA